MRTMRKIKTRWRKAVRTTKIVVSVVAITIFLLSDLGVLSLSLIESYFYYGLGAMVLFGFLFLFTAKFKFGLKKYINSRGYVVLTHENELEHRFIAKRRLERELKKNEVVHHINGNKVDNKIENLCVMDSEKHEFFHAWLIWKRKKSGKYPSLSHQKRILVQEYGGLLLEQVRKEAVCGVQEVRGAPVNDQAERSGSVERRDSVQQRSPAQQKEKERFVVRKNRSTGRLFVEFDEEFLISPDGKEIEIDLGRFRAPEEVSEAELTENQIKVYRAKMNESELAFAEEKTKLEYSKRLFNELRKERKRLAFEKGVPAYIVFDDKTLQDMAETKPDTEAMMLQVRGVGPAKLQMYGVHFLNVIKRFKANSDNEPRGSQDSA